MLVLSYRCMYITYTFTMLHLHVARIFLFFGEKVPIFPIFLKHEFPIFLFFWTTMMLDTLSVSKLNLCYNIWLISVEWLEVFNWLIEMFSYVCMRHERLARILLLVPRATRTEGTKMLVVLLGVWKKDFGT